MKTSFLKIITLIILCTGYLFSQNQFQSFIDNVNSLTDSIAKSTAIDSFIRYARTKGIPFIENNTANFFYRGNVSSVCVASDFNGWSATSSPMTKLQGTNFFYLSKDFEPNARLDYKFVINNTNWILDPENPRQILGGFGPNSELAMPDYVQPWEINFKASIKHGRLMQRSLFSQYLNANYQIQIYLPPDYDSISTEYPAVYFQDGFEYITLASAVNILDNLIDSNKIEPIIAVFVKPNNRNEEYAFSKRNEYRKFFIYELVPFVDSLYSTNRSPERRLILGDSYGGNISALISYNHTDVFGNCGLHSAAFQPNNYEAFNLIVNGPKKDLKFVSIWGSYESLFSNMRAFRDSCLKKGYDFTWSELPEGHSWGLWRATLDIILMNVFPAKSSEVIENDGIGDFRLYQNYPNPFNNSTKIKFFLKRPSFVSLKIINLLGEEIHTLLNDYMDEGHHIITLDTNKIGNDIASGIYFYKLESRNFVEVKKTLLIK